MPGHDPKGRSSKEAKHVRIYRAMCNTEAWRGMKPGPRALYLELGLLYNGSNNGDVFLSQRDAAQLLNVSKDTAKRYFDVLVERGFIKPNVVGSFDWKQGKATTWILTVHEHKGKLATRDYLSFKDTKRNSRSQKSGQSVLKTRTVVPFRRGGNP